MKKGIITILIFTLSLTFISCERRKVILIWNNTEFRKGDKVEIIDTSGMSAFESTETNYPISILCEKGKTGTVIKGIKRNSKEIGVEIVEDEPLQVLLIEWDAQNWEPYYVSERNGRKIKLNKFKASIHADYLKKICDTSLHKD